MIYSNKFYSIEDIAKKLKIKISDIEALITFKIIPTVDLYGYKSLEGSVALGLVEKLKEFNEQQRKAGKTPKKSGAIDVGGMIANERF